MRALLLIICMFMFSCGESPIESGVCEHRWDKWKRSDIVASSGHGIVYERECDICGIGEFTIVKGTFFIHEKD
jgi:hypothetical protein